MAPLARIDSLCDEMEGHSMIIDKVNDAEPATLNTVVAGHPIAGCDRDAVDTASEVQSVGGDAVEHELRVVRRRARLIAAAEKALGRTCRQTPYRDDEDADATAEGVCMAVHGYLRAVGQLRRYNRNDVLEHLDACIAQDTTTRVFVSRYLAQQHDVGAVFGDHQQWTVACDVACNSVIVDQTRFCLRRGDGVSMFVTVRRLPRVHLASDSTVTDRLNMSPAATDTQ